jgi:hypothetical protein
LSARPVSGRSVARGQAGTDFLAVFCPWPKTLPDFLMPDACFTAFHEATNPLESLKEGSPIGTGAKAKLQKT